MTSGFTADGFCVRNSTPGVSDGQAVDQWMPDGGGTWGEATAEAKAASTAAVPAMQLAVPSAPPVPQAAEPAPVTAAAPQPAQIPPPAAAPAPAPAPAAPAVS